LGDLSEDADVVAVCDESFSEVVAIAETGDAEP
jgi:hypothetical protein